ncbi:hypothetical protein KIPB_005835 [Kipferlia bialata]|uniref:Uncharacterized protein n=1 Tax=Kipferlia bialata TaxID=797122 RepID=A0A9K3GJ87_9EUKA|nr:hypothetical protein KIPB_005835 [Kipferlia bialata]|eukprot:g5835.t1
MCVYTWDSDQELSQQDEAPVTADPTPAVSPTEGEGDGFDDSDALPVDAAPEEGVVASILPDKWARLEYALLRMVTWAQPYKAKGDTEFMSMVSLPSFAAPCRSSIAEDLMAGLKESEAEDIFRLGVGLVFVLLSWARGSLSVEYPDILVEMLQIQSSCLTPTRPSLSAMSALLGGMAPLIDADVDTNPDDDTEDEKRRERGTGEVVKRVSAQMILYLQNYDCLFTPEMPESVSAAEALSTSIDTLCIPSLQCVADCPFSRDSLVDGTEVVRLVFEELAYKECMVKIPEGLTMLQHITLFKELADRLVTHVQAFEPVLEAIGHEAERTFCEALMYRLIKLVKTIKPPEHLSAKIAHLLERDTTPHFNDDGEEIEREDNGRGVEQCAALAESVLGLFTTANTLDRLFSFQSDPIPFATEKVWGGLLFFGLQAIRLLSVQAAARAVLGHTQESVFVQILLRLATNAVAPTLGLRGNQLSTQRQMTISVTDALGTGYSSFCQLLLRLRVVKQVQEWQGGVLAPLVVDAARSPYPTDFGRTWQEEVTDSTALIELEESVGTAMTQAERTLLMAIGGAANAMTSMRTDYYTRLQQAHIDCISRQPDIDEGFDVAGVVRPVLSVYKKEGDRSRSEALSVFGRVCSYWAMKNVGYMFGFYSAPRSKYTSVHADSEFSDQDCGPELPTWWMYALFKSSSSRHRQKKNRKVGKILRHTFANLFGTHKSPEAADDDDPQFANIALIEDWEPPVDTAVETVLAQAIYNVFTLAATVLSPFNLSIAARQWLPAAVQESIFALAVNKHPEEGLDDEEIRQLVPALRTSLALAMVRQVQAYGEGLADLDKQVLQVVHLTNVSVQEGWRFKAKTFRNSDLAPCVVSYVVGWLVYVRHEENVMKHFRKSLSKK